MYLIIFIHDTFFIFSLIKKKNHSYTNSLKKSNKKIRFLWPSYSGQKEETKLQIENIAKWNEKKACPNWWLEFPSL